MGWDQYVSVQVKTTQVTFFYGDPFSMNQMVHLFEKALANSYPLPCLARHLYDDRRKENDMQRMTSLTIFLSFVLVSSGWAQSGSVIRLSIGQVQMRRAGSMEWEAASNGMRLAPGDSVRTLGDGRCELSLAGNRTIRVESNASLTIPKSKYNDDESIGYLDLLFGKLWAGIEGLRGQKTRFVIRTPNALGGVKGTTFWVVHDRIAGTTDWSLLEGELEIHSRRQGIEKVVLTAGERVQVNKLKLIGSKEKFDPAPGLKTFRRFFFQKSEGSGVETPLSPEVKRILSEEGRLVNSLRRFSSRPAVTSQNKVVPAMVQFANQVANRSLKLGSDLNQALRNAPIAQVRQAKKQYGGHHAAILKYYQIIVRAPYGQDGESSEGNEVPPIEEKGDGQSDSDEDDKGPQNLGFLRQGIAEMNAIGRRIASIPKVKSVPRGLYRKLDSSSKKVTRKYSRLRPITPQAQKMYNDFTRARQRVFIIIRRRGGTVGSSSTVDNSGSDGGDNTSPDIGTKRMPPSLKNR